MTSPEQLHALADELFAAFERGDVEAIARCCDPRARVSQNGSPPVALATLLPSFATLRERIGQHRYTEVRRATFDDGFVEEHTVETVLPSGTPAKVRACVVVRVDGDGRVIELDEYLDPAALRPGAGR